MGKIVNQTELTEWLGVSDVTLWQWQKEGLPIQTRNVRGLSHDYDASACHKWVVAREVKKASGGETQQQRFVRLQADKLERELAEIDKRLIPADEAELQWAGSVLAARRRLLAFASQLGDALEAAPDSASRRAILKAEIDKVLEELSSNEHCERILEDYVGDLLAAVALRPSDAGSEPSAETVGPPAEATDCGMGGGEAPPQRDDRGAAREIPV